MNMLTDNDPIIPGLCQSLIARIKAQGVEQWLDQKKKSLNLSTLVYLCKFAYFTGIVTKAEIGRILNLEPPERKQLIRSWYDDHREKGCGTC
jgi:hypothetical protein